MPVDLKQCYYIYSPSLATSDFFSQAVTSDSFSPWSLIDLFPANGFLLMSEHQGKEMWEIRVGSKI